MTRNALTEQVKSYLAKWLMKRLLPLLAVFFSLFGIVTLVAFGSAVAQTKSNEVVATKLQAEVETQQFTTTLDSLEWGAKWTINQECISGLISPVKKEIITSKSGYRQVPAGTAAFNISQKTGEQINVGTDYAGAIGDSVLAIADAKVFHAGEAKLSGGGLSITLNYRRGTQNCFVDYNHLSAYGVKEGDQVKAGQEIGKIGASGNVTGSHLDMPIYTLFEGAYNFIDFTSDLIKQRIKPEITTRLRNARGAEITPDQEVTQPIQAAINEGVINRHTGAMILMLYPIESHGSGNWKAKGSDTGSGRFGTGLTQIMNFPEFEIAKKTAGVNHSLEEYFNEPRKQIQIIKGLMVEKQKSLSDKYDPEQAQKLARQWLGVGGCDMHGTCTETYADIARKNYEISFKTLLY